MIKLSKSDYEKILRHAESELPDEACGLIGGVIDGEDKIIRKVYLLTNTDHSNEHFTLDPKEQLAKTIPWSTGLHRREKIFPRKTNGLLLCPPYSVGGGPAESSYALQN